MKVHTSLPLAAMAALLTLTASVDAATLALYQNDSTPSAYDSSYTVNPIVLSPSFSYSSSGNWFARATVGGNANLPDVYGTSGTTAQNEQAAVNFGSFVEVSLTAANDYEIDVSEISAKVQVEGSGSSATDAISATAFLRSSVDNYTTTVASQTVSIDARSAGSGTTFNFDYATADSLSSAYQNISGTVNFRVYVYIDTETASSGQLVRLDNIKIDGTTVAIPESSSSGFIGAIIAFIATLCIRRHRH